MIIFILSVIITYLFWKALTRYINKQTGSDADKYLFGIHPEEE